MLGSAIVGLWSGSSSCCCWEATVLVYGLVVVAVVVGLWSGSSCYCWEATALVSGLVVVAFVVGKRQCWSMV